MILMKNHFLFFLKKFGKMVQNLPSVSDVTGALRVNLSKTKCLSQYMYTDVNKNASSESKHEYLLD